MTYLTKDQVRGIIDGAPAGTDPRSIVEGLVQRGHTLEGYGTPSQPQPSPSQIQTTQERTGRTPEQIQQEIMQQRPDVTPEAAIQEAQQSVKNVAALKESETGAARGLQDTAMDVAKTEAAPLTKEERAKLTDQRGLASKFATLPAGIGGLFERGLQTITGTERRPTEFIKQFGTGAEILEDAEGKNIEAITADLQAKGLSLDQAERAILNTIDKINESPDRESGLGKASQILAQTVAPIAVGIGVGGGVGSAARAAATRAAPALAARLASGVGGRMATGAVTGALEGAAAQTAMDVGTGKTAEEISDRAVTAGLFGGAFGAAIPGVSSLYNAVKPVAKSGKEAVGSLVSGFTAPKTLQNATDNVIDTAFKNTLKTATTKGGVQGRNRVRDNIAGGMARVGDYVKTKGLPKPENAEDLLALTTNISDDIFKQYDEIARASNLKVSLDDVGKKLQEFASKHIIGKGKVDRIVKTVLDDIKSAGKVSVKELQDQIAVLNERLSGANFQNLTVNQQADLVALAALRDIFKKQVVDQLGDNYGMLRQAYGQIAELKKALIKSPAVRGDTGYGDLADLVVLSEVVTAPSAEGLALMAAREGIKRSKQPNLQIQKFFESYDELSNAVQVTPSALEETISSISGKALQKTKDGAKILLDQLSDTELAKLASTLGASTQDLITIGGSLTLTSQVSE